MIVRNEAAILGRCFESVRELIDSWVICDTGSTDATREVVRSGLAGIPGRLLEADWVDFGHNRSELMAAARGAADYLLLLDADMTLTRTGRLPRLEADAYLLRTNGALDYGVIRLVRGDREWWYEGSTHEHIATNGRFTQAELEELGIEHHADGGSREDKLLRDVGLLKRDLARNPQNPRPVFYLAQTFRELGNRELAVEYYRRRVELGGWDEEVFYANLQEGIIRAEEDSELALATLLEAWERRPSRAEPLYELARLHRRRGDFAVARLFASEGIRLPQPDDVLFIHRWVYDWGLPLEHALAEAGLGHLELARDELRALIERQELPHVVEQAAARVLIDLGTRATASVLGSAELARIAAIGQIAPPSGDEPEASSDAPASSGPGRRRRGGTPRAERLSALAPGLQIGEIKLDVRPAWPCFNPSIARNGDGFRMVVRTANYEIERGVRHAEGVLQNINYLVDLDAALAVTSIKPIVDRSPPVQRFPSHVQGYEDCRLIEIEGEWYATATVSDLNDRELREIALLTLVESRIVEVKRLPGPQPDRHEKNWMPFSLGGALHFVYTLSPTVVLRCDPTRGEAERVVEHPAPTRLETLRGGSQGVLVDDGYLFVAHEVDRTGPGLCYLHRLVLLGRDLQLVGVSPRFTFTTDRIEFCAGAARREESLVLSFGISDAAAGLAVVPLDQALALIDPVEAPSLRAKQKSW